MKIPSNQSVRQRQRRATTAFYESALHESVWFYRMRSGKAEGKWEETKRAAKQSFQAALQIRAETIHS